MTGTISILQAYQFTCVDSFLKVAYREQNGLLHNNCTNRYGVNQQDESIFFTDPKT